MFSRGTYIKLKTGRSDTRCIAVARERLSKKVIIEVRSNLCNGEMQLDMDAAKDRVISYRRRNQGTYDRCIVTATILEGVLVEKELELGAFQGLTLKEGFKKMYNSIKAACNVYDELVGIDGKDR